MEQLTVKKFLLKKYPTHKYIDCPVPKHHWDTMQEYAEAYHESIQKERDKHIADKAWDAGFERGASVVITPFNSKVPNKEMYLKSLKQINHENKSIYTYPCK